MPFMREAIAVPRVEFQDRLRPAMIRPQINGPISDARRGVAESQDRILVEFEQPLEDIGRRNRVLGCGVLQLLELFLARRIAFIFFWLIRCSEIAATQHGDKHPTTENGPPSRAREDTNPNVTAHVFSTYFEK